MNLSSIVVGTRRSLSLNLISCVAFFYFFTSSADVLNIQLFVFKAKLNNVIAVILFTLFFCKTRLCYLNWRLIIATLFILSSIFISTTQSAYIWRSVGYGIAFLVEFFFYFLLTYNLVRQLNEKTVLQLYWTAFICLGIYALMQLFLSFFGIYDPAIRQFIGKLARPHAFTYEPSYYALCMTSFVMYYNIKLLYNDLPFKALIPFLCINALLLVSTSTGAFFSYFILIPVTWAFKIFYLKKEFAPYYYKNIRKIFLVFISSIFVLFIAFRKVVNQYFFKFFIVGTSHWSFAERWASIVNSWNVFCSYPLFGKGIGGVGPYIYHQKHDLYEQTPLPLNASEAFDPSNVLTEILGSLGIYGVCCFLLLIGVYFSDFGKIFKLQHTTREEKLTAIALFVSFVMLIIVLQFNQGLFRNYIWIHSGITIGYIHKLIAQDTEMRTAEVPSQ